MCLDCRYDKRCEVGNAYHQNRHHLYWPKCNYRTDLESEFREHPDNSEYLCRLKHDLLHARTPPPTKPTRAFMLEWLKERS